MTKEQAEKYIAGLVADGASNLVIKLQRAAVGLPPDDNLKLDDTLPPAKVQPSANIVDLRGVEAQADRFKAPASKTREKKDKSTKAVDPTDRWDLLELGEAA